MLRAFMLDVARADAAKACVFRSSSTGFWGCMKSPPGADPSRMLTPKRSSPDLGARPFSGVSKCS